MNQSASSCPSRPGLDLSPPLPVGNAKYRYPNASTKYNHFIYFFSLFYFFVTSTQIPSIKGSVSPSNPFDIQEQSQTYFLFLLFLLLLHNCLLVGIEIKGLLVPAASAWVGRDLHSLLRVCFLNRLWRLPQFVKLIWGEKPPIKTCYQYKHIKRILYPDDFWPIFSDL